MKAYIQNLGNSRKLSAILVDHLHVPASIAERTNLDLPARRLAHGLKSLAVQAACPVISTVNIAEKQAQQIPDRPLEHSEVQDILRRCRPRLAHLSQVGIEQEADLVLGLLNHAAQYCMQGKDPLHTVR